MDVFNKKIKGLTINYEYDLEALENGLLLRYLNQDFYIDIETKIKHELNYFKKYKSNIYKNACVSLSYWKYKFLIAIASNEQEEKNAYKMLKESYKMGNGDAMAEYGYYYYTGTGPVKEDKSKATKLFEKSKNQDSLWLEYLMAEAIVYNQTDKDALKKAIPYYEKALEKKIMLARVKLADLYVKFNVNLDKAVKLYEEEAKESGNDYTAVINLLKAKKR